MNFLRDLVDLVLKIAGKIGGVIGMFVAFLDNVKKEYPGLIEIMEPLVQEAWDIIEALINSGASEEEIEAAQAKHRKLVVTMTKEKVSGSPRAVSEQVIRSTLEAIVAGKKFEADQGDKYDVKAVKEHATDILSKYGAGGGN